MPRAKTDMEKHPENYFVGPGIHPRDRIIIHQSAEIPKEGRFISLNGYAFLAKPEEEIDLPRPVRKMLDTRIYTVTMQDSEGREYTKDIKRVPYTIIQLDVGKEEEAKVNDGE